MSKEKSCEGMEIFTSLLMSLTQVIQIKTLIMDLSQSIFTH